MIEHHGALLNGYLRLSEVLKIIPVSRSTWYRGIKAGRYPQPVKLGLRASGWPIQAVHQCAEALAEAAAVPCN